MAPNATANKQVDGTKNIKRVRGDYPYAISVIMPVYNTEAYLCEAIESVILQTLGFQNIQLILVNDGSTDGSGDICKAYAAEFPRNIEYVEKENGGVASACNTGLSHVKGKYVNFFGSDDRWHAEALEKAVEFLEQNHKKIDLVACRLEFFDAQVGFKHPLDYRFRGKEAKIVNLSESYTYIQMMSGNCVIKAEALADRRFNEKLALSEDAFLITDILMDKMSYGLLATAVYEYRKRNDGNQLTTKANLNKDRYIYSPREFSLEMLKSAQRRLGYVPRFIQYTALYETQWAYREMLAPNMTEDDVATYESLLGQILDYCDWQVIKDLKSISWAQKIDLLRQKYGAEQFESQLVIGQKNIWYQNIPVVNLRASGEMLTVKLLDIKGGCLVIEGIFNGGVLHSGLALKLVASNGVVVRPTLSLAKPYCATTYKGDIPRTGMHFKASIPLQHRQRIEFVAECEGLGSFTVRPGFSIFAKVTARLKHSYYSKGGFIVSLGEKREFRVRKWGVHRVVRSEANLIRDIVMDKRFGPGCAVRRAAAKAYRVANRRPIWLISDRFKKAGDNGENLFKYIHDANVGSECKIYFVFEKEFPDYKRLRQYGKILDPHSKRFDILFLAADKIISSHADATVINPFQGKGYAFADMLDFDYVYIQHGVMPGNLSVWLNKMNKNTRLITTSSPREREQLLLPEYGYDEEEIALTGMTRHDALGTCPVERTVVFLPTWRAKLAGETNAFERTRSRVQNFAETEYCKFYNALINDDRLIKAMRDHGYRGEFYVHPSFEQQAEDFHGNDVITVGSGLANYESILNTAALMVTDYSSVAFDFGVQSKPVVYTQFDHDHIWDIHFYEEGYFKYEEDGFGPVCYDYDECVDTIVSYIQNDCAMPASYAKRCEDFFAYHDHDNSKRVYEAIRALDD